MAPDKPNYLVQMFLRAGNNPYYNVSLAMIYRWSRNDNSTDQRATTGVYDSTPLGNTDNGFFGQGYNRIDCGRNALAYCAR